MTDTFSPTQQKAWDSMTPAQQKSFGDFVAQLGGDEARETLNALYGPTATSKAAANNPMKSNMKAPAKKKSAAKKKGGGFSLGSLLDHTRHDAASVADKAKDALPKGGREGVEDALEDIGTLGLAIPANSIGNAIQGGKSGPKAAAAPTSAQDIASLEKQIAALKGASATAATAPADPLTQLGQAMTNTFEKEQAPVEKAISGGDTTAAEKLATSIAEKAAGVAPGSSSADWLTSNIDQANAADQPMLKAMNQYGQEFDAGQKGIDSAMENLGQANQLGLNAAPSADWLNSIANHLQTNISYEGTLPQDLQSQLPSWLVEALKNSGGPSAGGNQIPLSSLNVPGGGNTGIPAQNNKSVASALGGATAPSANSATQPDTNASP